ncbi:MAG: PAS domain S-box protein [Bacteroidota bacterium]
MAEKKKSKSELLDELSGLRQKMKTLKKTERTLSQERILLRTLIDHLPDAIFAKDISCRKTIANLADVHNMGFRSEAEVLGKDDFSLFPKEIAQGFFADDQSVVRTGTPVLDREEYFIDPEGRKRWLLTSKLPLKDERGKITGIIGIGRDITERKNADEALRREKGLMDALMESVPDSIYFKDRQCRLTKISRNMMKDLKVKNMNQVIGKTDVELFGEEFGRRTLESDQGLMAKGNAIVGLTESIRSEDGSIHWMSTTKVPLRDDNGQIVGLVGITREINELMKAQQELAYRKHYLESLVESSPIAIVTLDVQQRVQTCNKAFETIFGYSSDEAVGKNLDDLIVPEDKKEEGKELTLVSFDRKNIRRELVRKRKDGSLIDVEVHATSISMDEKQVGVIAQYEDITDRKQAERELRESTEKLQLIFDNAFDGINIFEEHPDPERRKLVDCNARYAEMAGRSREELLRIGNTRNIAKTLSQDNTRSIERALIFRGSFTWIRPDGKDNIIEYTAVPIKMRGKTFTIGIDHDVTERTKAEAQIKEQIKIIEKQNLELEKARDLAMEANKTKSAFLASMSHELRTPLNAIIGYSEMILEEMGDANETHYQGDLERIRSAGKNLLELINEVLDLSKIEAGKMELYLEEFQLGGLVDEVVSTVQPLMEKNENTLLVNVTQNIPTVRLDHTKVRQILFNLISNASKFTQKGTITLYADMVSAPDLPGRKITLKVTDTGIGLTEEQIARLFKEFSQADSSTTRKYGGTGLGLAITKRFTDMMNGSIDVQSEPNEGTTFIVTLPLYIESTEETASADVSTANVPAPVPTNTAVLVVDDDPSVRDLLMRYLSKDGYLVECVASGDEGIKRAKEILPMAIILDVMMPHKDGWAVLQEIKSDSALKSIPVIMYTMVDEKNIGLAIGASDYLIKPVSKEKILQVLEKYKHKIPSEYVLIVDDNPDLRTMASRAIQKAGWNVQTAENGKSALSILEHDLPGIIFLDLMMPVMDGFEFLTVFQNRDEWKHIPVVVITSKDLMAEERRQLSGVVKKIIQKGDLTAEKILKQIASLIPQLTQNISSAESANG